ncbi:unnamed protein product [Sphagnum troendelagicum]|uniref:Uncharacterized protein n=1 Tax=Sphagnum troendelagicum TaxID=128251 RepID=A0ABP0UB16_9BRYO
MEAGAAAAVPSLREQGNALFKEKNYLKAAAVYTQAIKADPENAALYSNRSAAFLNLVKLTKSLTDAEMTIKLRPTWEKGYFRKGCVLEAMERFEEALATYHEALKQNPQSAEVAGKIKRLTQLVREKKRSKSAAVSDKHSEKVNGSQSATTHEHQQLDEVRSFVKEVIESSMKEWNDSNGKVDAGVRFCVGKDTSKEFLPLVGVDKAFESPDTVNSCADFLRRYAVESSSMAAVLVVPKKAIAFPQVWKGQGSRKWKASNSNGFFIQMETSALRRLWFVASSLEQGHNVCRTLEQLDIDSHAVLPPLFR